MIAVFAPARTFAASPAREAPHPFRPDVTGEPGYRPHCLTCGGERAAHLPVPAPRSPADVTRPTDTEERR